MQTAGRQPRAYLAGPEVFLADRVEVFAAKAELCRRHGIEPAPPMDAGQHATEARLSRRIYLRNRTLMDGADLIIANLSPYRGVSADAGTVFEFGYGLARGLPVFGYSNDPRDFFARVTAFAGPTSKGADNRAYGTDGCALEDFGLGDNLMIDETLEPFGGLFRPTAGAALPLSDLVQFERCLAFAARYMRGIDGFGSRPSIGRAV
jgi:nucleoside 2-deoxyribosyltransferase